MFAQSWVSQQDALKTSQFLSPCDIFASSSQINMVWPSRIGPHLGIIACAGVTRMGGLDLVAEESGHGTRYKPWSIYFFLISIS